MSMHTLTIIVTAETTEQAGEMAMRAALSIKGGRLQSKGRGHTGATYEYRLTTVPGLADQTEAFPDEGGTVGRP